MLEGLANMVFGFLFLRISWLCICACIVQFYECGRCDARILNSYSGQLCYLFTCVL
jgi:hypothetical protein